MNELTETRIFTLKHCDDYRTGPSLYVISEEDNDNEDSDNENENSDNEEDESSDEIFEDVEFEINGSKILVYYLSLGIGEHDTKFLKSFDTIEEAMLYGKKQYKLFTGDNPFITNGKFEGFYRPSGSREEIHISDSEECNFEDEDDDAHHYLVFISKTEFISRSLNSFGIWE